LPESRKAFYTFVLYALSKVAAMLLNNIIFVFPLHWDYRRRSE